MTSLPMKRPAKRLGLVTDLDICVGCHACTVSCQQWNAGDAADQDALNPAMLTTSLNRVFTYEAGDGAEGRTVHFPKSCLHCEDAACVTVCPTGAAYKRDQDGVVLVDEERCIGCGFCAWACPYGACELDTNEGVMKKCTLCIDRIYNETLPAQDQEPACVTSCPAHARHFGDFADPHSVVSKLTAGREGYDLMPALNYHPTNKYLPPRKPVASNKNINAPKALTPKPEGGFLGWLDRVLSDLP